VALKCIPESTTEEQSSLLQEVKNHASLPVNPYILPFSDVFADQGYSVLVLPLADTSLQEVISDGGVEKPLILLRQLANGLYALHKNEKWHGDLKPANVLMFKETSQGEMQFTPKLADFGVQGTTPSYAVSKSFPSANSSLNDKKAWDAFALGVIGFQLFTGTLPEKLKKQRTLQDWGGLTAGDRKELQDGYQNLITPQNQQHLAHLLDQNSISRINALNQFARDENDLPTSIIIIPSKQAYKCQQPTASRSTSDLSYTSNSREEKKDVVEKEAVKKGSVKPAKNKKLLMPILLIIVIVIAGVMMLPQFPAHQTKQIEAAQQALMQNQVQKQDDEKARRLAAEKAEAAKVKLLGKQRLAEEQGQKEAQKKAEEKAWKLAVEKAAAAKVKLLEKQRLAEERGWKVVGEERVFDGITFVWIPQGEFMMGSDSSGSSDEKPVHKVRFKQGFWMGKYEVTQAQWQAVMEENPRYFTNDSHPMEGMSWGHIQKFIHSLNGLTGKRFRLPTEAEWEYAARAGSTSKYSWGDRVSSNKANCKGCGSRWDNSKTAPVGSFKPNSFGLYDMNGNVWEWVEDCYHDDYNEAPTDGGAWRNGNCGKRVLRGGSWGYFSFDMRSANRHRNSIDARNNNNGFRLVQDN
ncbi:MAG: SUMF1/EgtB/PvdO family nonheme iron enzyme, partial [Mariprofundaceae bacterium]|nr:SUMF1/EgtB/PvdO family nonheme iron enzyme [Mariprofundaceae bacterium]